MTPAEPCQPTPGDASGNPSDQLDTPQVGITPSRSGAVRRVVQLVECNRYIVALCDDGSMWANSDGDWTRLAPPPGCGGGG